MIEVSLIVATLGRFEEVQRLLSSLARQTIDARRFEVIVVDQNDSIDLTPLIAAFSGEITIVHMRSTALGLSLNRNKGLEIARGTIVAFPDDDCTYYPDTLDRVLEHYRRSVDSVLLLGSVYDRSSNQPVIRRWRKRSVRVTHMNFFFLYSSITVFSKLTVLRFDERLGAGAPYGSYEEADYVFRALRYGFVQYNPAVQVWHAPLNARVMPPAKIRAYGLGFGAFIAKHHTMRCIGLFLLALLYHLGMVVKSAFWFDIRGVRSHFLSITSRISGVVLFFLSKSDRTAATATER